MTIEAELHDGRVLEFPDGTAPEVIQATVKKMLAPTKSTASRIYNAAMGEEPSFANVADVLTGATGTMRGAANLASEGLGDRIWPKSTEETTAGTVFGSLADPLAWGIAGGVGKVLPYANVVGKGIKEGAKALLKNATSGAITGGAIGGLADEGSAEGGAALGAGLNVALPAVVGGAGRVVGKVADVVTGRLGDVKAANMLREAAGKDFPAIQSALASSGDDITAAQAASGVGNDAFSALGELAKVKRSQFFTNLLERQKQERIDAMRKLASGATQTEARQATDASKRALNRITTPMRETELAAANVAGTTGRSLQGEAQRLGDAASSNVADVRRLENAKSIAEDVAQSGRMTLAEGPQLGMPRISGRYSYADELAKIAESNSQNAADASLLLGDASRFAQSRLNSIEAHGLRPLDTSKVVGNIARKLNDPSIGVDPINAKVLKNVAKTIATWTAKGNGVIDASALYQIRKSAINSEVTKLLGTSDPKANAKYAARLLNEIKPTIDNAIEAAGGTGWKDYLSTFESGMRQINQQQMGGKALQLLENSPNKFESLVAGNEPKMVEKIFKTDYDIKKAMGEKIVPMQKAAEELARDRQITEGAARGAGQLGDILEKNITKFRLPNWINAKIAVTNRGLIELESRVNKRTMNKIYEAMQSGQKALDLLKTLPAHERMPVVKVLMTQQATPYMSGAITNVVEQGSPQ